MVDAGRPQQQLTWALVAAVLGSWCLAAVAALLGVAPAQAPQARALPTSQGPVVLVGIPGLTWDLIDESTPTLQGLADTGGSAALVVRGPDEVTCAADAWLTVGAGSRTDLEPLGCDLEADAPWGALGGPEPDLAELTGPVEAEGGCVATYGLTASADAAGRPVLDTERTGLLSRPTLDPGCELHLVASIALLEGDRSGRLTETDAALADLIADAPPGTTLLVSGMGHTAGRADAQVLLVSGQGGAGAGPGEAGQDTSPATARASWSEGSEGSDPEQGTAGQDTSEAALLTSGSTRQSGLVQLVDLTPTLLSLTGIPPDDDLPGDPVEAVTDPTPAAPSASAAELAEGISLAKSLAPWVLGALAVMLLPALVVAGLLDRSARSRQRVSTGRRRRSLLGFVATTVMAAPAAAFLAGVLPWWQAGQPWPALVLTILVMAVAIVGVARLTARGHASPLLPPAVVATVTLVVLGVDTLWSSRLGLVSVLGLQPVTAGRFYGQGNVGFGIVLGALLVLLAAVLSWLPRRGAALAVALLGGGTLVLGAAPAAGADFGSVPATAVVTGLVLLAALGVRWTWRSLLLVAGAAAALAVLAMVLDWLRGPEQRTHLGAFVQAVLDGEALGIITRKLDQSLGILVSYPLSWLAVVVLAGLAWVVVRRPAWAERLWREPGVAPVASAGVVGMAVAWLLNDSGIAAVALCLTILLAAGIALWASTTTVGRGPGRAEATGGPGD